MTEESDFKKYFPKITEVTVNQVAQSYGIADGIVSLDGKRTGLTHFILLLATDAKTIGPYLLNPTCARALCARLLAEGFGPPPKS
jgi:hypothetical protein